MKNIDITYVRYNGNEVSALYKGGTLVYQRLKNILAGKFSEPGDYTIKINGVDTPLQLNSDNRFSVPVDDLTTCKQMFVNKDKLLEITQFPSIENVTDMKSMFAYCKALTNVNTKDFDTSNVTDMSFVFSDCHSLETLDLSSFDTSNAETMYSMFAYCKALVSLDLSGFDTSNVKTMIAMFANCESLESVDLSSFDTSNVTDMYMMFSDCSSLKYLDLSSFDTSNVDDIRQMFSSCTVLHTLVLGNFDFSKCSSYSTIFWKCNNLANVSGSVSGIKYNIDFKYSPLTNESALLFINGLNNIVSSRTITFKSTTFSNLTEEQIALATSKGWSVVSA